MRPTSLAEVDGVLRLDGPGRFLHFVKRVVDEECAWGLWNEGWALMSGSAGQRAFPLWPAREYAQLLCRGEWVGYEPMEIPLESLMEELLPQLEVDGVRPGVFPTPSGQGVTPTIEELRSAIRAELAGYEEI